MIADLLQHVQQGEDVDVGQRAPFAPQRLHQRRALRLDRLPVHAELLLAQAAGADILDLLRQFVQNRLLHPAQDEGRGQTPQVDRVPRVGIEFVRPYEVDVAVVTAQIAGQHEIEESLQFGQRVLDRRAGQPDLHARRKRHRGPIALRAAVLDLLNFVEHDQAPQSLAELFDIVAHHTVRREHHVALGQRFLQITVRSVVVDRPQCRGVLAQLVPPVADHGTRADDQDRQVDGQLFAQDDHQGHRLVRLAEPHVVAQ